MSRSGSTIIGGVVSGLPHKRSADFSFILAVPVIGAAVLYDLLQSATQLNAQDVSFIGLGFCCFLFCGFICYKLCIEMDRKMEVNTIWLL